MPGPLAGDAPSSRDRALSRSIDFYRLFHPLERTFTQRLEFKVGFRRRVDALTDTDLSRLRQAFQACRDVGCVTYGGIVHSQVITDLSHHNRARVDAHPQTHSGQVLSRAELLPDSESRKQCTTDMVFMCNRRAEKRHETIAQELIDGALIMVDFGGCHFEEPVEQVVHGFRTDSMCKPGGICDIAKKHRDLFNLALESKPGFESLLPQVGWSIGLRTVLQGCAAVITKPAVRRVAVTALWTLAQQRLTASATETGIRAILVLA